MEYHYKKPIYDPFVTFNPTKTFIQDVIKQLKEQAYGKTKAIQSIQQENWPVPQWLEVERRTLLERIKYYEYRLTRWSRSNGWEINNSGQITKEDIQMAKQYPIINLIQGGAKVRGRLATVRCPFHQEKTGSFVIYIDNNTWHCFGACGVGGDSIDFVIRRDQIKFLDAVKLLINK
jgi:hypothetical protein